MQKTLLPTPPTVVSVTRPIIQITLNYALMFLYFDTTTDQLKTWLNPAFFTSQSKLHFLKCIHDLLDINVIETKREKTKENLCNAINVTQPIQLHIEQSGKFIYSHVINLIPSTSNGSAKKYIRKQKKKSLKPFSL